MVVLVLTLTGKRKMIEWSEDCQCPDPLSSFKCSSCYAGICHGCVYDGEEQCFDCAMAEPEEEEDVKEEGVCVPVFKSDTYVTSCTDCTETKEVDVSVGSWTCGKCAMHKAFTRGEI